MEPYVSLILSAPEGEMAEVRRVNGYVFKRLVPTILAMKSYQEATPKRKTWQSLLPPANISKP